MDKGKEDPVLDNADDEGDGRRSTEINIDMLAADRRDSFEVARISSPEVGSVTFSIIKQTQSAHFLCQGVRPIHSTAVVKSTNMADPAPLVRLLKYILYGVTFFSKARLACMTDLKHPPDNWLRDDPATKGFVPPTQVSWIFNEILRI